MPDSVTFGCPAPRLGLTLARLAACLPATLAFAQLRLCAASVHCYPFWPKIAVVRGNTECGIRCFQSVPTEQIPQSTQYLNSQYTLTDHGAKLAPLGAALASRGLHPAHHNLSRSYIEPQAELLKMTS